MSVINQMLRDLDDRQSNASNTRFVEVLQLRSAVGNVFRGNKPVYLWAVFLICAVSLSVVLWRSKLNVTSLPSQHHKQALSVLAQEKNRLSAINQTEITQADWQFGRTGTLSLKMLFDRLPEGVIEQNALKSGEIEFVLPHTRIDAAIPVLNTKASPLESYQIGQRDDNVVITVKAVADAKVSHAVQIAETADQTAGWVLRVEPAKTKPVTAAKTVKRASPATKPATVATVAPEVTKQVNKIQRVKASYQRALHYLQINRVSLAVDQLEKTLAQNPTHHDARELLANLYRQNGREAEANVLLRQGIELAPSHLAFPRMVADALIKNGELQQAASVLEHSAAYAHNDAEYIAMRAAVAQRLTKHDEAVRYYMQALDIYPRRSAWWMGLGMSLEAMNKIKAASGAYVAAVDSGQLNAELLAYVNSRLRNLERL